MIFCALFHEPLKISGRLVIAKSPNIELSLELLPVTGVLLVSAVVPGGGPGLVGLTHSSSSGTTMVGISALTAVVTVADSPFGLYFESNHFSLAVFSLSPNLCQVDAGICRSA